MTLPAGPAYFRQMAVARTRLVFSGRSLGWGAVLTATVLQPVRPLRRIGLLLSGLAG